MNAAVATILVIEDNRVNRLVTERLLLRWKYEVVSVGNAEQAYKAAGSQDFDLILLNLHLPDAQGWEVISRIKLLRKSLRTTPVIAISADGGKLKQTEHLFTATLHKPYMPESLQQLIFQQLAKQPKQEINFEVGIVERLRLVTGGDQVFEQQLAVLFTDVCEQVLRELDNSLLEDSHYLAKLRHKQRSSLRLLKLYAAEAALDNLQDQVDASTPNSEALSSRKSTVRTIFRTIRHELAQYHNSLPELK